MQLGRWCLCYIRPRKGDARIIGEVAGGVDKGRLAENREKIPDFEKYFRNSIG
jgi:hypothetical protein